DDERIAKAVELGGEREVGEHERQEEGEADARRAVRQLARLAGQRRAEALGQRRGGDLVERLDAVAEGVALGRASADGGRDVAIEAIERRGGGRLAEGDELLEAHELAVAGAEVKARQIG